MYTTDAASTVICVSSTSQSGGLSISLIIFVLLAGAKRAALYVVWSQARRRRWRRAAGAKY